MVRNIQKQIEWPGILREHINGFPISRISEGCNIRLSKGFSVEGPPEWMVTTRWCPAAQGIKCQTVHSERIPGTSDRVWSLRRIASIFTWFSLSYSLLGYFLWGYIQSECMQPLHQHCRNFEIVSRRLGPACHLPSYITCSGKWNPVSRCELLLKDTILNITDKWASFPGSAVSFNAIKRMCVLCFLFV